MSREFFFSSNHMRKKMYADDLILKNKIKKNQPADLHLN